MRVGDILRVPQPKQPTTAQVDGLPNLYFVTRGPSGELAPFSAGINGMAAVGGGAIGPTERRPAVLVRSSPHKAGSEITPWQDRFDPDRGHVRYFGDNKLSAGTPAHAARGNKLLLRLFAAHTSPDLEERADAVPLVFFEGTPVGKHPKGHVRFQGFGIILRTELVTEIDPRTQRPFANYAFDCLVMSLADENEEFDWRWINERRNPDRDGHDCLELAPRAWRDWVVRGPDAFPTVRRRVSTLLTSASSEQRPAPGSRERRTLDAVYRFYDGRKSRFEALAEIVAERVLRSSGASYRRAWITRGSSDEGIDFVGRLDVGDGFSTAALVVLGQAKCERPDVPTGGNHIARTVARLRRGWVGVYVTTSYFSRQVQREIYDDRYPIVLIHGLRVAEEVLALMIEKKVSQVDLLLQEIDATYESRLQIREAEEVLFDR